MDKIHIYKKKYLKYKNKHLNSKNINLKGGTDRTAFSFRIYNPQKYMNLPQATKLNCLPFAFKKKSTIHIP